MRMRRRKNNAKRRAERAASREEEGGDDDDDEVVERRFLDPARAARLAERSAASFEVWREQAAAEAAESARHPERFVSPKRRRLLRVTLSRASSDGRGKGAEDVGEKPPQPMAAAGGVSDEE